MADSQLHKRSRQELLEMLLTQQQEIERLQKELDSAKAALADRELKVSQAGSLAMASLQVTAIFEEAQRAADLYVDNIRRLVTKEALEKRMGLLNDETKTGAEQPDNAG